MVWKKVVAVLALVALCGAQDSSIRDKEPKIVNGTDAEISDAPFIVSLQYITSETQSYHSCGGSILSKGEI